MIVIIMVCLWKDTELLGPAHLKNLEALQIIVVIENIICYVSIIAYARHVISHNRAKKRPDAHESLMSDLHSSRDDLDIYSAYGTDPMKTVVDTQVRRSRLYLHPHG